MRCSTFGEHIYKGKKFNSQKETVENERYLGLYIFGFYIKCLRCAAKIAFKTGPENCDYTLEDGATSNSEALENLEELCDMNSRHAKVDHEQLIKMTTAYKEQLKNFKMMRMRHLSSQNLERKEQR